MTSYPGKILAEGVNLGEIRKIEPLWDSREGVRLPDERIEGEKRRAGEIFEEAVAEKRKLIEKKAGTVDAETLSIMEGHIIFIEDEEITGRIIEIIDVERLDFASACRKTMEEFEEFFANMTDAYLKERIADIKDICAGFIKIYRNEDRRDLSGIVVADEIAPSDVLDCNPDEVLGFITEKGARNSHAAILARTLGIPFLTGIENARGSAEDGARAVIDSEEGLFITDPDDETWARYLRRREEFVAEKKELEAFVDKPDVLADGTEFPVGANVSNALDIGIAEKNHAGHIGLFRSEYLYMDSPSMPDEDSLFERYRHLTENFAGEITVRTLDVGGDKEVPYFEIGKEENPFLGFRAIRYCLAHPDVFKAQLRAILRLSALKKVRIMIPMVTCVDEVVETRRLLEESKEELRRRGARFADNIELGIMIETPSSVMISGILAKELDFFSIGSNDLIQYSMAADRNNPNVEALYTPYSRSFIGMIETTVENAHGHSIPVSVCGEVAADTGFLPILIGLGVDGISVAPGAVLKIRRYLESVSREECREKLEGAKKLASESELKSHLSRGLP